eukprot:TRINITY_DN4841_c0_g1_i2.p1 TRINITY_DN4841_c0_g1~~TRINITY_DN4841_c0_g1_i2.p1  ORF type:complete len:712 (-),score=90.62 TRINITY_DN4841_c0_g1_i2:370-2208(-)
MAVLDAALACNIAIDDPNEDGLCDIVQRLCAAGADVNLEASGWGTALDAANGDVAALLESRGGKRSQKEANQPLAKGAERYSYGCFESGADLRAHPEPVHTGLPMPVGSSIAGKKKVGVGDMVKLRVPKPGLLKMGDVGEVVGDDGSDCVPLKIKFGDTHDYYEYMDVEVCVDLGADSDRGTPEGTLRYTSSKLHKLVHPRVVGSTGLSVSPIGFGCHRLCNEAEQREALAMAVKMGCNFIDVAPNYSNGVAEEVVGSVLGELFASKQIRRDELIIATKVGNVLGRQLSHKEGVPNMSKVSDDLWHCISPPWIEQEITRSLQRLQLECVDFLLLHCPEFETKASGVDMPEVYRRLGEAFTYLEQEVTRGRIAYYGVSAAFSPLRPTDPEHLDLHSVMRLLPEGHHFRSIQFPLNFAEANDRWVAHVPRRPDGAAVDPNAVLDAPTLFEAAEAYGLGVLINRPLDGIWKESHGVLRFSSLDSAVRSFSELQLENCDVLEEKLTTMCQLTQDPFRLPDGATGQLAAKTIKVLTSLDGVACVLLGMRQPEYVVSAVPLTFGTPRLMPELAYNALKSLHSTVEMWYATAIHEADHGTSKSWRLKVDEKFVESNSVA